MVVSSRDKITSFLDVLIRAQSVASDQNLIQMILCEEGPLIVHFRKSRGGEMTPGITRSRGPNDIIWILILFPFLESLFSSGLV